MLLNYNLRSYHQATQQIDTRHTSSRGGINRKNLGGHGSWAQVKRKGEWGQAPRRFCNPALSKERDWLLIHKKANENAIITESRQNNREIRVQEDKIKKNANARS